MSTMITMSTMNTTKQYVFHSDPGHAWLAVKRAELVRLDILHKISSCSFQRGGTVYLEEDCDAAVFIEAKETAGEKLSYRESYRENTPIRNYDRFTIPLDLPTECV